MERKPIVCLDCQSRTCEHLKGERFLSPRQIQVVRFIGEGLSNKEIAYRMGIQCGSVKTYLSEFIFPRLNVHNRVGVARYAWENADLLRPTSPGSYAFPVGI